MEWDNEKCLQLIDLYRLKPEIWQSTHKLYSNRLKKQDAWNEMGSDMGTTVDVIKAKLNSLLSSFRRERARESSSVRTGKGQDEVYRSKWFAYKAFDFLMDKNKCKKTLYSTNKGNSQEPINEENEDTQNLIHEDKEEVTLLDNLQSNSRENINAETTATKRMNFTSHRRRKCKHETEADPCIEEAYNVLKTSATRDACDIYGEHIAMKLRNYSSRTQSVVQHLFNNILFNADMGQYDENKKLNYNNVASAYQQTSAYSSENCSAHAVHSNVIGDSTCSTSTESASSTRPHCSGGLCLRQPA
ncbi:Myb/SANT-like transcription factor, partial [Oryctes borbonicus]